MKSHEIKQNGTTWTEMRLGIPTASQFKEIITPEGKPTKPEKRRAYLYKLLAERLLKQPMLNHFESYWMNRGRQMEEEAATEFAEAHGVTLLPGGFVTDDDGRYGASPDRLIKDTNEAAEIKVPAPFTHIQYLLEGPGNFYRPQIEGQMLVCGFDAVHFFSWNPGFRSVDIYWLSDPVYRHSLVTLLNNFCDELDAAEREIRRVGGFKELSGLPGSFPWLDREGAP